jgi:hypothetical protein
MSESWKEFSLMVSQAYDQFWEKNRLAYKNGRIIRTGIPRVRPKPAHELDFRNKKKGTKYEDHSGANS